MFRVCKIRIFKANLLIPLVISSSKIYSFRGLCPVIRLEALLLVPIRFVPNLCYKLACCCVSIPHVFFVRQHAKRILAFVETSDCLRARAGVSVTICSRIKTVQASITSSVAATETSVLFVPNFRSGG